MAEPTGIEQVLINFILNARDAGAHLIRIETAHAPGRAGHLRLSISDDGAGIPGNVLSKLFQPFFTTKAKGTGLGLWLSQRIVQDHGGNVTVESEVGKGTTFTITLPTMTEASSERVVLSRDDRQSQPQVASAQSGRSGR
jgi:signal transduction histidine kinase